MLLPEPSRRQVPPVPLLLPRAMLALAAPQGRGAQAGPWGPGVAGGCWACLGRPLPGEGLEPACSGEGSSSQDVSTENEQPCSPSGVSSSVFLFRLLSYLADKVPRGQEHHLGPRGWVDLQQNGNSGRLAPVLSPSCLCCSSCCSYRRVPRRCCSSCGSLHTKGKRCI